MKSGMKVITITITAILVFAVILGSTMFALIYKKAQPTETHSESSENESNSTQISDNTATPETIQYAEFEDPAKDNPIKTITLSQRLPSYKGKPIYGIVDVDDLMAMIYIEGYEDKKGYMIMNNFEQLSKAFAEYDIDEGEYFEEDHFDDYYVVVTLRPSEFGACLSYVQYLGSYDADVNILTLNAEYIELDGIECEELVVSCLDFISVPKSMISGDVSSLIVEVNAPVMTDEQRYSHINTVTLDMHGEYPCNKLGFECNNVTFLKWKTHPDADVYKLVDFNSKDIISDANNDMSYGVVDNYSLLKEIFESQTDLNVKDYYQESIFEDYVFLLIERNEGSGLGVYVKYDIAGDKETGKLKLTRYYIDVPSNQSESSTSCLDFIPIPVELIGDSGITGVEVTVEDFHYWSWAK